MTNEEQYAVTMDQLARPESWDVPGVIVDIKMAMLKHEDGAAAAACIDTLRLAIREIDALIRSGPIINAKTIKRAGEIAGQFVNR